jgi:hypothetical protein
MESFLVTNQHTFGLLLKALRLRARKALKKLPKSQLEMLCDCFDLKQNKTIRICLETYGE